MLCCVKWDQSEAHNYIHIFGITFETEDINLCLYIFSDNIFFMFGC